jgi:hypothetical protein
VEVSGAWRAVIRSIARDFLKVEVDLVPLTYFTSAKKWLFERYGDLQWFEVYDLIEFLVQQNSNAPWLPDSLKIGLVSALNAILEDELSAFRFVGGRLVPISSALEVAAIEGAIASAQSKGLDGVEIHLKTALARLAQKPAPDYRNSVKESISAVESAARQIGGGTSLKAALASIEKQVPFHPALKGGFLSLYGYTSDKTGIRHAILDSPNDVGFDEAKFMLVACSAFVHFLIGKTAAAGLIK